MVWDGILEMKAENNCTAPAGMGHNGPEVQMKPGIRGLFIVFDTIIPDPNAPPPRTGYFPRADNTTAISTKSPR